MQVDFVDTNLKHEKVFQSLPANTCTGEMASRLLVLGARPFGITPGGGCRALFITLLQLATIVRIVSDSSWETLLKNRRETNQVTKR